MMATLIGWTQAESLAWDGERLEETTDVSPVVWNRSGSPQWCWALRCWKRTVCKSFVDSTDVVPVAASPRCSIEITINHVNLLTNHDGTDCEDELFGNTPFVGVDIAYKKETAP